MQNPPLRIIPLGGLGKIGRNMMVVEYNREIVVIDAGILFPATKTPGVDFAIPNIAYLKKNSSKVRAFLITHGHEDHIGALPFILKDINAPVYASRLTHGLINVKLREHGLGEKSTVNIVEPYAPFKIGPFRIEFFKVCHSIPDAMGIAIKTPLGLVIHTGDFKIDHTPADGMGSDLTNLAKITADGVFLLCSDSTYSEVDGYTESESVVGAALDQMIGNATGRVIVATFASLISRIQQTIDAAVAHGRFVSIIGRSMNNNVKMALKMGYLSAPEGTLVSIKESNKLPDRQKVILATGSQGEPTSALVRITNGDHQDLTITRGDTVVISSSPIPGNETVVSNTIDNLYRQGANVFHSRTNLVHVHGHASREELKMMIGLVKPTFFVPIHGEYRHLATHASIARDMGIPEPNTFVLEDGDVLELESKRGRIVDQVPADHVLVNGRKKWNLQSEILTERRTLYREGVVVVNVNLDKNSGTVANFPKIVSYGFAETEETTELFKNIPKDILTLLDREEISHLELIEIKKMVSKAVSKAIRKIARRHPVVLTVIEKI